MVFYAVLNFLYLRCYWE